MTSSSSLYGTVTQQNVSSTNSTSLYGEAGTPIPDSSGNLVVRGDLTVLSGNILTTATTGNIFPANATTINLGLAATTMNIGAGTGTTTVNNNLVVSGDLTVDGTFVVPSAEFGNITVGVVDDNTISTTTGDLVLESATNLVVVNGYLDVSGTITTTDIQAITAGTGSGTGLNLYSNNAEHALHLYDDYVQITSGTAPGADWVFNSDGTTNFPYYQFPSADGTADQVLATDGSGTLAWTSVQSLDTNYTIDASATTGGANFNLQGSDSTTDTIKFANGTGVSVTQTDANTITITNTGVVSPYNIDATATTGGANLNLNNADGTDSVAFKGSGATTVTRTSADIITISSTDTNTTYDFNATATTGGANLNLVGSDSTTDTVKLTNGGHITATYTSATEVTLGSDATDANTAGAIVARDGSGNFSASGATLGNVAVAITDDNTINTTTGDLKLDAATNLVIVSGNGYVSGYLDVDGSITTTDIQAATAGTGSGTGLNLYSNNAEHALHLYDDYVQITSGTTPGADWVFNPDGSTNFPYYKFPSADGTANQVLTTDGAGNVSWALPGGGGSTFGNVTVGVATDNTISTTTGDLVLNSATGIISVLGQIVSTRAGSATTGAGQIYLNGSTSNRIDWAATGTGAPAFTTRSDGTKAVLYPALGASAVDYALGVEAGALWSSIPGNDAGQFFKWYGGTTQVASLGGTGNFTANSVTANGATVGVSANQFSTVSGNATLNTANGTNSGSLVITAGVNGAITLAPNGTGNVVNTFSNGGNLTNNRNYVFGAIRNSTTASIGDIWATNSTGPTQPFRGISLDNSADTAKNAGYVARNYSNTAGNRSRLIFERARGTAASPTAVQLADFLGDITATGYTSTGWINDNISPVVPASFNFAAAENWVSNTNLGTAFNVTLAPTATTMTSAANLVTIISATPQTSAFRSDSTTFSQGKSGTTTYATLALTGNTLTALNSNNLFIRQGTTNATLPALNVRYQRTDQTGSSDLDGVDFRLSTAGTSTTNNIARVDAQYRTSGFHTVGISVSTDNFAADADTVLRMQADKTAIRATPTGTTGTASDIVTVESTKVTMAVPVAFPAYTKAAANAITGAVGWQICISDSAQGSNPNGMMAFWDTTNSRWSYIHDNSAV